MKQITKLLIGLFLSFTSTFGGYAQNSQTVIIPSANSFSSFLPYTGTYNYGVNPGYYSAKWTSQNVADLASGNKAKNLKGVGVKTLRIPLYDDFFTKWGIRNLLNDFQYYSSLGIQDITAFIGSPDATHVLDTTFPGSPEPSKVFKNLYEPVWLDDAKTIINTKNYFAKYLYDVVTTYGSYIKFWEVVNEPDFTYNTGGWQGDLTPPGPNSWFYHNPTPADLVNMRAPIFYYIRELRVAREVIKRLSPNSYICTGGIGYKSFLDALLRNTDNPDNGAVTDNFPLKAGAYFDVLSFHCYPEFSLKSWDSENAEVKHYRHSDAGADAYITIKNNLDKLLMKYGYDNNQYPKKQFICTETGVSRIVSTGEDDWGSNEAQKNFMIKGQIASQKNGIKQTYWYQLGDFTDPNQPFDRMGLYYYFGNTTPYSQAKTTDQGKALKTTSDLLIGKVYDEAKTASLKLSSDVGGAAFKGIDGNYTYVLWAKTSEDESEDAEASYSFPKAVISSTLYRKEWDFSETGTVVTIGSKNIQLTATPSFFEPTQKNTNNLIISAGADTTISLPANSITFNGLATDVPNAKLTYAWSKVGGPDQYAIGAADQAQTVVNNLTAGSYQFEFKVTDNSGAVSKDTVNVTVLPNQNYIPIPATIRAENYSAMYGVETEPTSDYGAGKDVGYIDPADWMEYNINVPAAGNYLVSFRVASPANNGQFQLRRQDGSVLATVNVPNTGDYQQWQTESVSIRLTQGVQTIRIVSTAPMWNSWNINLIDFAAKPADLHIEAENYSSLKGVKTERSSDDGGGLDVGYIDKGDWMDYSINVPSQGVYTVSFRIATAMNEGQFNLLKADGSFLTSINIPNTSGFQSWQTVSTNIILDQGQQTIRISATSVANWNINWFELVKIVDPAVAASFKIEAENYIAMSGVQTESTTDAGGGLDVDYIDPWDWMNYSVNIKQAGFYNVDFRVASPNKNAQFQLRNMDGAILASLNVPNTGSYQTWQTIRATVNLPAGQQTLRIISTGNKWDNWNINWLQFTLTNTINTNNSASTVQRNIAADEVAAAVKTSPMAVHPNPAKDQFMLHINNKNTGTITIELINLSGMLQKRLFFIKPDKGDWEREIFIRELPAGAYFVKAQIGDWSETKKILKEK